MTEPTEGRGDAAPPNHEASDTPGLAASRAGVNEANADKPETATAEAEKAQTEIEAGDVADELADFA